MTHNNSDNLRIQRTRPLISPAILAEQIPLRDSTAQRVARTRTEIANVLHGKDPRLLTIVGPCSVHDPKAVTEYAQRLAQLARQLPELLIVMRVYFEKPRTTVGWKGFINDPHLDGSYDVNVGLAGARQLLADITSLQLPTATEFLDTTFGQYFTDFISWGAIGARTAESQIHRQLASGLSMPVGIKNATSGDIDVAIDAIIAAQHPHLFPSLTKEGAPALLETTGNTDAHLVLRGGPRPNYQAEHVQAALDKLAHRSVETRLIVDCSHANSAKDPIRQIDVARDVVAQVCEGQSGIAGIMLESHLQGGRQDTPSRYGQSITDACIDWSQTEALLTELAGNLPD